MNNRGNKDTIGLRKNTSRGADGINAALSNVDNPITPPKPIPNLYLNTIAPTITGICAVVNDIAPIGIHPRGVNTKMIIKLLNIANLEIVVTLDSIIYLLVTLQNLLGLVMRKIRNKNCIDFKKVTLYTYLNTL